MSHHTTTPMQDVSKGFNDLITIVFGLALFIGLPVGILCLIQGGMDNYKNTRDQNAWVRAHAVRVVEIKGRDTVFMCDDGIKYHLTPYLKGL